MSTRWRNIPCGSVPYCAVIVGREWPSKKLNASSRYYARRSASTNPCRSEYKLNPLPNFILRCCRYLPKSRELSSNLPALFRSASGKSRFSPFFRCLSTKSTKPSRMPDAVRPRHSARLKITLQIKKAWMRMKSTPTVDSVSGGADYRHGGFLVPGNGIPFVSSDQMIPSFAFNGSGKTMLFGLSPHQSQSKHM
jgi:hypothetical protein